MAAEFYRKHMPIALVTGATGFVGSHLTPALLAAGWTVRALARPGRAVETPGVATFNVVDLADAPDLGPALDGVDVVVHLAGRAHILQETAADPAREFRRANVVATERLARCAARSGCRRFVFLSSVGVNGRATVPGRPFTESDAPYPHNSYAASKWEAEQALVAVAATSPLETAIIRPPLVYGPGVRANFLRLVRLAASGLPLPLASVHNRRSLVGVWNLCDLILACAIHPAASGETFLVSDQHDLSTPDLIRRVARALGRPARLFPFPVAVLRALARAVGRGDEVDRLVGSLQADSTKATRLLGWRPAVGVEEGLRRTVEWYLNSVGQVP